MHIVYIVLCLFFRFLINTSFRLQPSFFKNSISIFFHNIQKEAAKRGELTTSPVKNDNNQDGFNNNNAEDKNKSIDNFEDSLPINERFGYATILVGEHTGECVVYLDLDYVVLEQKK